MNWLKGAIPDDPSPLTPAEYAKQRALGSARQAVGFATSWLVILAIAACWSGVGSVMWTTFSAFGAAFFAGHLIGFIFGVARPSAGGAAPATAADAAAATRGQTLLERVAEWFVYIGTGATIANAGSLGAHFESVASWFCGERGAASLGCYGAVTYALWAGGVSGFMMGFLWSKLRIMRAASDEDRLVMNGEPQAQAPRSRSEDGSAIADDPYKGQFGQKSNAGGYRLSARLVRARGRWYDLAFTVEPEGTPPRPSPRQVTFYLHPTFPEPVTTVPVVGGKAELRVSAWGAFTLGAEVGAVGTQGPVRLELDLTEVEALPEAFKRA